VPPTLTTDRLILRPLRLDDAHAVWDLARDRAIADTTATVPHPYERSMADSFIAMRTAPGADEEIAVWALERQTDGRFIGVISLAFEPAISSAELGYWVGVPFWSLGYTTEAGRSVLDQGFRVIGLASVNSNHLTRNPASHRVMEKLGMRTEGVLRRRFRKWGVLEDICHHSILREDWPG
jgi:RimJ/RimL family protein N-acetyltransferase